MGVEIVVKRPCTVITLSEWMRLIDEDDQLRLRSEPYVAVNPNTGAKISIKPGKADSEIQVKGQWVPFLSFPGSGHLTIKYVEEFDDPQNISRVKIAEVARRLGALIGTDAGDELLRW